MVVTAKAISKYRSMLSAINQKAAAEVQEYIVQHGYQITEEFLEFAYAVSTKYGEAAGALACQFYDELADYWKQVEKKKTIPPAEPSEVASYEEVAKNVVGTIKTTPDKIPEVVSRLVKRTAEDTTLKNAMRDFAECAWIPQGDTCSFCIMLASNGWRKASKKSLRNGHAEHIHPNCDCTYVVRFDPFTDVEGYEPGEYLQMYEDADGYKWRDKLNSMRREQYQKNKEEINERKRINYAERKEREAKTP